MIKKIRNLFTKNKEISMNIIGAFGIRGISMIVSLFTMPVYIRFFEDRTILGLWYTILSVLNWLLYFDLGLGNGLRNKLPEYITNCDDKNAREYITTTYIMTAMIVVVLSIIGIVFIPKINWNELLSIDGELVNNTELCLVINIVFLGIMLQFVLKLITSILYALQRSVLVNMMTLSTTIITLILVSFMPSKTAVDNLQIMAWINIVAVNIPYALATIFVFSSKLKDSVPRLNAFNKQCIKYVLNTGLMLLWLQLVFMVISNTNELLISNLTGAKSVVDYQAYNKIYNTIASIFSLAITPIWSAVTKAKAEKNFIWIAKLNNVLLYFSILVFIVELIITPFLQIALDIWIGQNYVVVDYRIALIFVVSNSLIFLHNVNTSMCNGMSYFKVQFIWMTFAAIINIPLAITFVRVLNYSWVGVILANIFALLPFEVIEIFAFKKIFYRISEKQEERNKMDEILVSVIIPTYRRPKYLSRAIESVRNQTYHHIEIIVVSDNEAESEFEKETIEVVKYFDGIVYLRGEGNRGGCHARNRGLGIAKGHYVNFLDDDDIMLPTKIEEQIVLLKKCGKECAVIGCWAAIKNAKGKVYRIERPKPKSEDILHSELVCNLCTTSISLINAEICRKAGGFQYIESSQEHLFLIKVFTVEPSFCYVNKVLVEINQHDGQRVSNNPKKPIGTLKLSEFIEKNYMKNYDEKQAKLIKLARLKCDILAYCIMHNFTQADKLFIQRCKIKIFDIENIKLAIRILEYKLRHRWNRKDGTD